jgi:hypothetical protein
MAAALCGQTTGRLAERITTRRARQDQRWTRWTNLLSEVVDHAPRMHLMRTAFGWNSQGAFKLPNSSRKVKI